MQRTLGPIPMVGILLAANRIVRIFSSTISISKISIVTLVLGQVYCSCHNSDTEHFFVCISTGFLPAIMCAYPLGHCIYTCFFQLFYVCCCKKKVKQEHIGGRQAIQRIGPIIALLLGHLVGCYLGSK